MFNGKLIKIFELADQHRIAWDVRNFVVTEDRGLDHLFGYPIRLDAYVVGICIRGTLQVEVNLQEYSIVPNCMLVTTHHHIIHYKKVSEDFACRYLLFSKHFLADNEINAHLNELSILQADAQPMVLLDEADAADQLDLFVQLYEKFKRSEHPFREPVTGNLLMVLLMETDALYQRQSGTSKRKITRKEELSSQFHRLVFKDFKKRRSVAHYAKKLFVSPKYLTEVVKEVTGKPAGEWINETVILEAKVLLKNPELNILQISDLLHFNNQTAFGKYFKQHTGFSPSAYRKSENN